MDPDRLSRPQVVLVARTFVKHPEHGILLMKRSREDRNNPGKWECPGGKVEMGQTVPHALEREVMEEAGLLVQPTLLLAHTDGYIIPDGKYAGLPYLVLFNVSSVIGGELTLSHEHEESVWTTYDQIHNYDLTNEVKKAAIILESHLR